MLAKDEIDGLILTERIEFFVPMTYMAMLLMAYYGPNADILGNVKMKMWHFQTPITDINEFVLTLSSMIAIDFFSFVINALLLWKFCNVNAFKVLNSIQKNYWHIMLVAEAYLLLEVHSQIPINLLKVGILISIYSFQVLPQMSIGSGHDLTLQFDWINQDSP